MKKRFFAAAIAAAALVGAPAAHADPANDMMHDAALFCRWLDGDNSPAGVLRAVNEFTVQQVPLDAAKATIAYALLNDCPEYQSAVAYAIDVYEGPGFVA